jgi:hypothetical protein
MVNPFQYYKAISLGLEKEEKNENAILSPSSQGPQRERFFRIQEWGPRPLVPCPSVTNSPILYG